MLVRANAIGPILAQAIVLETGFAWSGWFLATYWT